MATIVAGRILRKLGELNEAISVKRITSQLD
jgi:hypothetical protein